MKIKNENADRFTAQMIYLYAEAQQNDLQASTHFIIRLRARIRERQNVSLLWETGVIHARHWLVGLSFIALIFFISNLLVKPTAVPSVSRGQTTEALAFSDADAEWDDPLLAEESRKD